MATSKAQSQTSPVFMYILAFTFLGIALALIWPHGIILPLLSLVYVLIGFGYLRHKNIPPGKLSVADSMYFLGFLYTLISLGIALLIDNGKIEPTTFIMLTAGAVLSTAIGFFSRFIYLEWIEVTPSIASAEEGQDRLYENFDRIAMAMGSIENSLQATIDHFSGLETHSKAINAELSQLSENTTGISSKLQGLGDNIGTVGSTLSDGLADATREFGKRLDGLSQDLRAQSQELTKAAIDSVDAYAAQKDKTLTATAQALHDIVELSNTIVQKFQKDLAEIPGLLSAKINDGLEDLGEAIGSIAQTTRAAGAAMEETRDQWVGQADLTAGLHTNLKGIDEKIRDLRSALDGYTSQHQSAREGVDASLSSLNAASTDISRTAEAFGASFGNMLDQLSDAFEFVTELMKKQRESSHGAKAK